MNELTYDRDGEPDYTRPGTLTGGLHLQLRQAREDLAAAQTALAAAQEDTRLLEWWCSRRVTMDLILRMLHSAGRVSVYSDIEDQRITEWHTDFRSALREAMQKEGAG